MPNMLVGGQELTSLQTAGAEADLRAMRRGQQTARRLQRGTAQTATQHASRSGRRSWGPSHGPGTGGACLGSQRPHPGPSARRDAQRRCGGSGRRPPPQARSGRRCFRAAQPASGGAGLSLRVTGTPAGGGQQLVGGRGHRVLGTAGRHNRPRDPWSECTPQAWRRLGSITGVTGSPPESCRGVP